MRQQSGKRFWEFLPLFTQLATFTIFCQDYEIADLCILHFLAVLAALGLPHSLTVWNSERLSLTYQTKTLQNHT